MTDPGRMRAMLAASADPSSLTCEMVPVPDPGPGELLVEVRATESTGSGGRFPGSLNFTTAKFTVDAGGPVHAALDGEALVVEPPLRLESLPSALRVRVMSPAHAKPSHR